MASVQNASTAYAEAEKHLRKAQKELEKIEATYRSVYDEGYEAFGFLTYRKHVASLKSVIGLIAEAELAVTLNHIEDTEKAKELGIDVGPATGGDDISIMSGGPR